MSEAGITRRKFLEHGAFFAGALWGGVVLARPRAVAAAAASDRPVVLEERQWATVAAMTARILPSGDGPGAEEAACVNFIDKALAHEDASAKPLYLSGISALDEYCKSEFKKNFTELGASAQDGLLRKLQEGTVSAWPKGAVNQMEFFETVRLHTIIGFLADPRYGGNRRYAGWKLVGYPGGRHADGGYSEAQMLGKEAVSAIWENKKKF